MKPCRSVSLLAAVIYAAGILPVSQAQDEKAEAPLAKKMAGNWKGKAGKDDITFTFTADGKFRFTVDGETSKGTWTLDESVKPAKLDMEMEGQGKGYTIIEITAEGKMRLCEPKKTEDRRAKDFAGQGNDVAVLEKAPEGAADEPTLTKPEQPDPQAAKLLVGEWEGTKDSQKMHFSFKADGTFSFMRERASGKQRKMAGGYKTDVSAWPYKLDLKPDAEGDHKEEAFAIFTFDSAGNLIMAEPQGSPEKRPKDFDDKDKVSFKRIDSGAEKTPPAKE